MISALRHKLNRFFLMMLGLLFLSVGALQVGPSMVQAAEDSKKPEEMAAKGGVAEGAGTPEHLVEFHRSLKEREERLAERELKIKEELKIIELSKKEIAHNLTQLAEAEERLRKTIALADGAAENDLTRLTKVYENMKPKAAAAVFSEMDPNFAAGFLARMQPAASAAVMAGMEPKAAYEISVILAARNSGVPTE